MLAATAPSGTSLQDLVSPGMHRPESQTNLRHPTELDRGSEPTGPLHRTWPDSKHFSSMERPEALG